MSVLVAARVHFACSFGLIFPIRAERGKLLLTACDEFQEAENLNQRTDKGEGESICGASDSVGKFTNPLPGSMRLPRCACTEPCPTLMLAFPPRDSYSAPLVSWNFAITVQI